MRVPVCTCEVVSACMIGACASHFVLSSFYASGVCCGELATSVERGGQSVHVTMCCSQEGGSKSFACNRGLCCN